MENKPNNGFFGQNPSYGSKFCKISGTFLGHRAILARENYKIYINFIDVLRIHVVLFRFFSYPESQLP